jgi:predicted pyridoxine 5'-phosphate oxidase superfamily flavin-nucleotide-binding protein
MRARGEDPGAFHEGELAVQEATGERAAAERNSRIVSEAVPPTPARFLVQQRMLVLASVDRAGTPWASLVSGEPGFASTSDGDVVTIDRTRTHVSPDDALLRNLRLDGPLGVLAIDLGTRLRYRINGFIASMTEECIDLRVREAFVNCPKYIQRRHLSEGDELPRASSANVRGDLLDPERRALVRRADTMFVASWHPDRGADASHRGGEPGFLEILDERTIRVPEYAGNSLYNTLGNLVVSSQAGLAIVDFEGGKVLQLCGITEVVFDRPPGRSDSAADARRASDAGASGATGRYWDFTVSRWIELSLPRRFRWELLERSPFNPPLPV